VTIRLDLPNKMVVQVWMTGFSRLNFQPSKVPALLASRSKPLIELRAVYPRLNQGHPHHGHPCPRLIRDQGHRPEFSRQLPGGLVPKNLGAALLAFWGEQDFCAVVSPVFGRGRLSFELASGKKDLITHNAISTPGASPDFETVSPVLGTPPNGIDLLNLRKSPR
jgi:hypothetical protein